MVSLETFLPLIRGRLPGCPDLILVDAIRDACIEFCQRTQLLTEDLSVDVVANERAVELLPDTDLTWEVLKVWRAGGEPLTPVNRQALAEQDDDVNTGTPGYYYVEGDRYLVLGPVPDANETLQVRVTLRPKDNATRVHDVLWQDYRQPLCAGARAWVRRHYGEWVNPQTEAEDRKLFEYSLHNTNIRRAHGGVGTLLRARAQPF